MRGGTMQLGYTHYKALAISVRQRVATVTLQSGERFNAVNEPMHHELGTIFGDLASDGGVDVIVLTGAGNAFCAGADLHWLQGQLDDPPEPADARRAVRAIVLGLLDCPKPIVARVNGDAVGLGATLALMADIVIAVESARISDPHVRIGLVAGDGGALIWPLLVGYARAKEFLLTGNPVSASEAARIGLVNCAVPACELDATVARFVQQLAEGAPLAIKLTKAAVNLPLRQAVETVLEASLASENLTLRSADVREGVLAFLERRKPVFNGR
jgi:enoyl-CoA hydratase